MSPDRFRKLVRVSQLRGWRGESNYSDIIKENMVRHIKDVGPIIKQLRERVLPSRVLVSVRR